MVTEVIQFKAVVVFRLNHIQIPDVSRPQAPLSVGTDLSVGCGECHQGTHHPLDRLILQGVELGSRENGLPTKPGNPPDCRLCMPVGYLLVNICQNHL